MAKRTYAEMFEYNKNRIIEESMEPFGYLRFNVIEYMCSFPKINPYDMAVALSKDGYEIKFDDTSISAEENIKKKNKVERGLKT